MKTFALAAVLLLAAQSASAEDMPRLAQERVVLRTVGGDVVLGLYPEVAPRHVAQLVRLARLGVFDGTHFHRVHAGFVAQLSNAEDRLRPLTPEQKAAIAPLPAEFSKVLKHRRGVLSMARGDDPNGAETSFSILLGDAPHLDGQYTIFGRVEQGMEVLDEFVRLPKLATPGAAANEPRTRPAVRLTVERAEVAESPEALRRLQLAAARPVAVSPGGVAEAGPASGLAPDEEVLLLNGVLLLALASLATTGLAGYFLSGWLAPRHLASLLLVVVLVAGFMLFAVLVNVGRGSPGFALTLFLALVGSIRLMGNFEKPT